MSGSLPPFSSSALAPVRAQAAAMARPVAVDPTCATTSTSCSTSAAPRAPSPLRCTSTPSGSSAAISSASSAPVPGVRSLGLVTTVLPVTSAAPMSPQATATGSFHGVSATTTPRGSYTMRSSAPCSPARERPRCAGPSSAYWRRVATPAAAPACASARSAGAVRAHAGCAERAAATAAVTSASDATGTPVTSDPSAGSWISITRPVAGRPVTAAVNAPASSRLRPGGRGYCAIMSTPHLPGLGQFLDELYRADERRSRDEIVRAAAVAGLPAVTLTRLDALPEGEYAYDEVVEAVQLISED